MTATEFNNKYDKYLEKGHYGLSHTLTKEGMEFLDNKFQEFIKNEEFSYMQIKLKFGMGRFYCRGINNENVKEIEDYLTKHEN